jgi:hypothetical protein
MSTHDNFKKRVTTRKQEFDVNKNDILGTPRPPKKDQPKPELKPTTKKPKP